MNTGKWLVAVLAGSVLAMSPLLPAAEGQGDAKPKKEKKARAPKGEKKPASVLRGEYSIMASELKLDDAQKAKLEEAVKANMEAQKAWEAANGAKVKQLSEDMKKAREGSDKDKIKTLGEQMKALQAERAKLQADAKEKVMAVLTDQQKSQWAGFTLYRSVIGRFKRLNLTAEQDKKVRELCDAEAAKPAAAPEKGKRAPSAAQVVGKEVEEKVLTDAQKEELKKKPEPKPKPEKKEGAGKAGDKTPVVQ